MKGLSKNLSTQDMHQFLRVLSERNEKSSIPIPPEIVESVKKVGGTFIASLLTGDSLMLDMQINHSYKDVQASYKASTSKRNEGENSVSLTGKESTSEGKEAIKVVKAMKALQEKGINTKGMSIEGILDTQGLIQFFSGSSENNCMHNLSEKEKEDIQELQNMWRER